MATLARLFDFLPGDVIRSADVDSEFNQIINLMNGTSDDVQAYIQLNDSALSVLKLNQVTTTASSLIQEWLAGGVLKLSVDGLGRLASTVAGTIAGTGNFPFVITSLKMNPNLNADLLDGLHASEIISQALAGSVEYLTLEGDEPGILFKDTDLTNVAWAELIMLADVTPDQQLTLRRKSDNLAIQRWNIDNGTAQFHNVVVLRAANGDPIDITVAVGGSDPNQHLTPKAYVDNAITSALGGGGGTTSVYDPNKHLLIRNYVISGGTTLDINDGIPSGLSVVGASSTHGSGAAGMFAIQTSNATTNARAEFMSTATLFQARWGQGEWSTRFLLAPTGDVTDLQMFVGLVQEDISNPSATPSANYALFRYDTANDGTAFWRCASDSGTGTPQVTVTTVAITANTLYMLRIRWNAAATSYGFYINDTLVATHATTVPSSSALMRWCALQKALANEAKSMGIQWVQFWI